MSVEDYLHHLRLRCCAPGTIYSRRRILARIAGHSGVPLEQMTERQWAAWYDDCAATVSDATRGMYLSAARSWGHWAFTAGVIHADHTARLPRPRLPQRLPRPMPEHDLALALATADDRVRPMIVLAAFAGLRAMEIAGLHAADVTGGQLLVHGKGGKMRTVPVHPLVAAEIARLPSRGPLFPRLDGLAGPVPAHRVSQLVNDHLRKQGIAHTCHTLRHRFGSQSYQATLDLRMVQDLLGHANPNTTAGYAAWCKPDAERAVNLLPVA